jgi:hypothetical protein
VSKVQIGICLVIVAAVAVTIALVVRGNKDQTPDPLRACANALPLRAVATVDGLGPATEDLQANTIRLDRQADLQGGTQATILVPADGSYTLVAVTEKPASPGRVARNVLDHPGELVGLYVASTAAQATGLRACVTAAAS